jgi:probable rRNA maturation factor
MTISIRNDQKKIKVARRRLRQSLRRMMALAGCRDRELSILLTDTEGIREINRTYLGRDRATNVVSFSMSEGECGGVNPALLGDIVVSVEEARDEAAAGGMAFEDALDFLLLHGLLHLLGYDHEGGDAEAARAMREREQELFFALKGYGLAEEGV